MPKFQRLSIFVPKAYLNSDGTVVKDGKSGDYCAHNAPIVFENNSAGYMQMPHTWLGGPRNYAQQYLAHGLIYISCGCRGRESRDQQGRLVGKSPIALVDLKTAIRFLRHNQAELPGDFERIISVGWSAGGAMSSLLAVSGNHQAFTPYLQQNGAFMDESDSVYAAQIYCPIVDLEHADMAYEWMFSVDKTCENSPAGPAETMTSFKESLSRQLAKQYIDYVNGLNLRNPRTGEALVLEGNGRSGSFYRYFMDCLNDSATDYLSRLGAGALPQAYSVQDYLSGNYTFMQEAPMPSARDDSGEKAPKRLLCLGDMVSRPPKGETYVERKSPLVTLQGKDKQAWLHWDGQHASINDLDSYVFHHRGRMKPCTSFDKLPMDSGENEVFGNEQENFLHFSLDVAEALEALKQDFPAEYARYYPAYAAITEDASLTQRVWLLNPLSYIGTDPQCDQAKHYRIRVGASDADTSLSVSMTLALRMVNAGCGTVDYAMVWDQPHCEADYPGEVLRWIDSIR